MNIPSIRTLKTFSSRMASSVAIATLISSSLITAADARTMRVSSFEPAQGFFSSKILQPWIEEMNAKLSKGNSFKLYPGSILGAPPAQQELVKKGVADVALVVPTYSPGLFPLTSVVEIPGMAPTAKQGTNVLNSMLEKGLLDKEYKDFKIIALFTTPGYQVFSNKDAVRVPADMNGQKYRTPSPYGSQLLSMVGASGVAIPAPQVYENIDRGVVKGAIWTLDAYKTFRLNEVSRHITPLRMTASPLAVLMNRRTYDSLSAADKKVIDSTAGRLASEWVASVVDDFDQQMVKRFSGDSKVDFIELTSSEQAAWDKAFANAEETWVDAQEVYGIDGQSALDFAKSVNASSRTAGAE